MERIDDPSFDASFSQLEPSGDLFREAHALGFYIVGVTPAQSPPHWAEYEDWLDRGFAGDMDYLRRHLPIKTHPHHLLPGAQSIIAVGLNYHQPNEPVQGLPRIASYALGRDYHKVIRAKLHKLASWIESKYPQSKNRPCVDSAPIFERDYANLAGLGWFGKNTMLINSQRGSWFLIGILLTTVPFESNEPAIGGCGTCRKCIDACPTGAIVFADGRWQIDARQCISYLTIESRREILKEIGEKFHGWTFGCDICQEVCPFNQPRDNAPLRAQVTQEPDFLAKREWPSLVELAEIQYEKWDELTQGSAVRRPGFEALKRNAKNNLG